MKKWWTDESVRLIPVDPCAFEAINRWCQLNNKEQAQAIDTLLSVNEDTKLKQSLINEYYGALQRWARKKRAKQRL